MADLPTADDITPRWLAERLREAGHDGVEVKSFSSTAIGTGQLGKCIRYELDVVGGDAKTPQSLVGKFPSDDPQSRQAGVALQTYIKEVSFYQQLQSRVTISTPRCYYAEIEGVGPEFVLLLEDLAPAEQGDQIAGCSPDVARAAVLELVGLHAPSWRGADLRGISWLGEPNEATAQVTRSLYKAQLPGFLARYGARLAADEINIIESVAGSSGPPFQVLGDPFSLTHVDYRLDNLLIDSTGSLPRVTAVDWQSITFGSPMTDVAYFMGSGLIPEDRRAVERGIVAEYHAELGKNGIEDYDWDRCWEDYRRGVFTGIFMMVVASMMVQRTERGDEMFTTQMKRHSRQAIDLGSDEYF
ncbi:MAG: phosphotransferase [Chloroflexi bacterium]|nr:phosphotransferase [Chloroflexota bacterium]